MIPKVIHYCWFGRGELPKSAQKCIASWRKYLPDYEIMQWNEDNFDVNVVPYTAQAYAARKWAFVSDYARMWVLYHHGGLYFDTDVEVVASFDDITAAGAFMGIELADGERIAVAPGLGLGMEAGNAICREVLDRFEQSDFAETNGIVPITTDTLLCHGLRPVNEVQQIDDITVYPIDYFNPLDDATGRLRRTENTRSIHWYSKTWMDFNPLRIKLSRWLHRWVGTSFTSKLRQRFRK